MFSSRLWFIVSKLAMTRTKEKNKPIVTKLEYRLSRSSKPIVSKIGLPTFLNCTTRKKYKQMSKNFAKSSQKLGWSGMMMILVTRWMLSGTTLVGMSMSWCRILESQSALDTNLGSGLLARLGLTGQHAGWVLVFGG